VLEIRAEASRDDWTPFELFLRAVAGWDTGSWSRLIDGESVTVLL
jgi:hypothetical protein